MACDGPLTDSIPVLAQSVQETGRPILIATFASKLPVCSGMTLFRPLSVGVEIGRTEPCLLADDGALILVATDRSKAFGIDGEGELVESPVPRLARNGGGIDGAWTDLKRRMTKLVEETGLLPAGQLESSPRAAGLTGSTRATNPP